MTGASPTLNIHGAPRVHPLPDPVTHPIRLHFDFSKPENLILSGSDVISMAGPYSGLAIRSDAPYDTQDYHAMIFTMRPWYPQLGAASDKWNGHTHAEFDLNMAWTNHWAPEYYFRFPQPLHYFTVVADGRTGDWSGHQRLLWSRPAGVPRLGTTLWRSSVTNDYKAMIRCSSGARSSAPLVRWDAPQLMEAVFDGSGGGRTELWRNGVRMIGPVSIGSDGITTGCAIGAIAETANDSSRQLEFGEGFIVQGNLSDQSGTPTPAQQAIHESLRAYYDIPNWGDPGYA